MREHLRDAPRTVPARRMGAATCRDKTIYVHVLKWPAGKLVLPALPARIVHAFALTGGAVSVNQTETGVELTAPETTRNEIDTIIALQLDSAAGAVPLLK